MQSVDDTLGQILLEHGRIDAKDYEACQQKTLSDGIRFGEALLQLGVMTLAELHDVLAAQTEQKLIALMGWADGTFNIEPTLEVDLARTSEVDLIPALWKGIAAHFETVRLFDYFFPVAQKYAVATPLFSVHYAKLGAFLRESGVIPLLNGKTKFQTILQAGTNDAARSAQLLYLLVIIEMVKPSEAPGDAADIPEAGPEKIEALSYGELTRWLERIQAARARLKTEGVTTIVGSDCLRVKDSEQVIEVAFLRLGLEGIPSPVPERLRDAVAALRQEIAAQHAAPSEGGTSNTLEQTRRAKEIEAEGAFKDGQRAMRAKDGAAAKEAFTRALALSPQEAAYHASMGMVLLEFENAPGEAAPYAQKALQLNPDNVSANILAAQIASQAGEPDVARQHLQVVLRRVPHHPKAQRLLEELGA
jgi:tetratricopeptide (TPR) repeat protein